MTVYDIGSGARMLTAEGMRILQISKTYLPFLSDENLLGRFPAARVDMGAIKFVCNGADIMRPGITVYDQFAEGRIVCVSEPGGRFLAVGISQMDSSRMEVVSRGSVIKNTHYISDKYWEAAKTIR